jgi:hypothetical protein
VILRYIPAMRLIALAAAALVAATLPAAAQERQWNLDFTDDDAFLVFGVPESDDVGLSIWCALQSGKSKIFLPQTAAPVKPGHATHMTLTAGKVTVKLDAQVADNHEAGTPSLEAEVETTHPIFAAMLGADRLRVKVMGDEQIFPLVEADLQGLLDLCRKP